MSPKAVEPTLSARERVRKVLEERGPLTVAEIRRQLPDLSSLNLNNCLSSLRSGGVICHGSRRGKSEYDSRELVSYELVPDVERGPHIHARAKTELPGRDDVELWGLPLSRAAARAVVEAVGRRWGREHARSPLRRAIEAHGYRFAASESPSDPHGYEILDPPPPTEEELAERRRFARIAALERKIAALRGDS